MSSSVPYDPYIPSGGSAQQGEGNQKTAAIQAVSEDTVARLIHKGYTRAI